MNLIHEIVILALTAIFIYLMEDISKSTIVDLIMYKIMAELFYHLILSRIISNFIPKDLDMGTIKKMVEYWPKKIKTML